MNGIPSVNSLILCWVLFSIIALLIGLFGLRWAVKTGQFSDPERCAQLPLEGKIPEPLAENSKRTVERG